MIDGPPYQPHWEFGTQYHDGTKLESWRSMHVVHLAVIQYWGMTDAQQVKWCFVQRHWAHYSSHNLSQCNMCLLQAHSPTLVGTSCNNKAGARNMQGCYNDTAE